MTESDFAKVVDETITGCRTLLRVKGHDYSGTEDRLLNFKRTATRVGITPKQVLQIYMTKHLDAIDTFCRDGQVKSEPIEGRIQDAINYLFLLQAMVKEESQGPKFTSLADDLASFQAIQLGKIPILGVQY